LPFYAGTYSQPDDIRGQIWNKVMADGIYRTVERMVEVRRIVKRTTFETKVKIGLSRTMDSDI
jgi:hypothetical protein